MKKYLSITLIVIFMFNITGCSSIIKPQGSAKLALHFDNISEIAAEAQDIIECKITNEIEDFVYSDIEFIKTNVEVTDVLFGDQIKKGDKISILQTNMQEKVNLPSNKDAILFIEKYEGPVTEDAYIILGEAFGYMEVENGKIKTHKEKGTSFASDVKTVNDVEKLKSIIEKAKNIEQ